MTDKPRKKGFKSYSWGLFPFISGISIVALVIVYVLYESMIGRRELVMNMNNLALCSLFIFLLILTFYSWFHLRGKIRYQFLTVGNVTRERLLWILSERLITYEFKDMNQVQSEIPFKNVIRRYYSSKGGLDVLIQEINYKNLFLQSKNIFKINIGPIDEKNKKVADKIKRDLEIVLSKYILHQELL